MTVLMADGRYGLRRRVEGGLNEHGEETPSGWGPLYGPHEGRARVLGDGTWSLGVDPALWPVRQGDLIIGFHGGSWLVQNAVLLENNYDHRVDWVRVSGLHRSVSGSTEPGGAWFIARYSDYVEPPPPEPGPPVFEANVWTGHGPPPAPSAEFAPAEGDEYVDLLTGLIYVLQGDG